MRSVRAIWAVIVVTLVAAALARAGSSGLGGFRSLAPDGGTIGTGSGVDAGAPTRSTIVLAGSYEGDVRDLPPIPVRPRPEGGEIGEEARPSFGVTQPSGQAQGQSLETVTGTMPDPSTGFDGLAYNQAGTPPDAVGDVGPNHYVEAVNTKIGIYTKAGAVVDTFTFDELWAAADSTKAAACKGYNYGDPTVVFDPIGQRWIVGDFAFVDQTNFTPPYYECIAVSQGVNPARSGWHLYAVRGDDATHPWFPDYPKMGVWPGSLLMTANMFTSQFKGVRVWAFNLADLESGAPSPRMFLKDLGTKYFSLLPANFRGLQPPTGSPAYFVAQDWSFYRLDVWKWAIDWNANTAVWSGPTQVSETSFPIGSGAIVPQLGTTQKLDALDFRLLMQAQYRNINGVESIWVTHTANSGPTGIHWAQLNVTNGAIALAPVQQGIWTGGGTDGLWRWLPSLAVDRKGNMAMGYSVSSGTMYPAIRYAGRLVGDTLGTLGQAEVELKGSLSNQINIDRWGDYFAMSVDPIDDCTFWFVGEYIGSDVYTRTINGQDVERHAWRTRIGSFRYPDCSAATSRTLSVATQSTASGAGRVTSNPGGIDCGSSCSLAVPDGTIVKLTALPASGSVFRSWTTGPCSGQTTTTCTFTVSGSNVSATADFATTRTLTILKVNGSYGTVTSSPSGISCGGTCSYPFTYGSTVTLTATPSRNRGFSGWSGDACAGSTSRTCIVVLDAAKTVTATFRSTA